MCLKVMFLHLSVSHSVHRGCLPQCMLGYTPPRPDTPPGQTRHPPPQQTVSAADVTHPTGMLSCSYHLQQNLAKVIFS